MSTGLVNVVNALLTIPGGRPFTIAGTDNGIWRSVDRGRTWRTDRSSPRNNIFALAAASDGTVYASGSDGRVYTDRVAVKGDAWHPISPPLAANPIFSVAVSTDHQTLLAGSIGALYRGTIDRSGWHWQTVVRTTAAAAITAINWASWNRHLVFATAFEAVPPVLLSGDDGQTWRPDARGLPSVLPTQSLRAGDVAAHQIYLSTMGGGVWLRSATGVWSDVSAGLPHHHAMPLMTTTESGVLYAGTMGYGVYEKRTGLAWQRLGHGLSGASAVVLSLTESGSTLLAGTAHGLFRYVLP